MKFTQILFVTAMVAVGEAGSWQKTVIDLAKDSITAAEDQLNAYATKNMNSADNTVDQCSQYYYYNRNMVKAQNDIVSSLQDMASQATTTAQSLPDDYFMAIFAT